jgi:hypothetical protein
MDCEIEKYHAKHPLKFQDDHGATIAFQDDDMAQESSSDNGSIFSFTK